MAGPVDPKLLERHWVHSHEEDTATEMVFRPADYAFPPSRGRYAFALSHGGGANEFRPGAADRPESAVGRWTLEPDGRLVLASGRELTVASVTKDKLVVKKPKPG